MLNTLEKKQVTTANMVHDYAQISFGDEIGISIYNDFSLSHDKEISFLIGKTLESVDETSRYIEFLFSGGICLRVDLHPQASHGPEALELNRKNLPTVIWN
jgi:hypothetical protein